MPAIRLKDYQFQFGSLIVKNLLGLCSPVQMISSHGPSSFCGRGILGLEHSIKV